MALYDVSSGYIAAYSKYQVIGGTSVVYNGATYYDGSVFVGTTDSSKYTETAGTEMVTPATDIMGINLGIENDYFTGLYPDDSYILGIALGMEAGNTLYKKVITNNNRVISKNGRVIVIRRYE